MQQKFLLRMIALLATFGVFLQVPAVHAEEAQPHIQAVEAVVQPLLKEGHFPGAAVAVMREGKPIHVGTYGFANVAHKAPVSTKTVFELASLTKQMTALAALDLAHEDRLALDDRLARFVADTPQDWSEITVNQLLGHMAGLSHRFEEKPRDEFLLNYSTEAMLAAAKATPMASQPGTDWKYSDQGYFLLGLVIESATGKSFSEYMQERYFGPLGMVQTHLMDQSAVVPHLAQGYIYEEDELRRGRRVWQFGLTSHFGVMSSLDDMMRWEAALSAAQGSELNAIRETWEIQRQFHNGGRCTQWGYARGWWVIQIRGRLLAHHAGYSGTAYIRDVSSGLSAVVLTNREASEGQIEPMAIAWAAMNAVDPEIPSTGYRCWE